jgi:Tfp pilus assembly protein PilN
MIEINLLPGAGRKSKSRGGAASRLSLPSVPGLSGGANLTKDPWLMGAVVSALIGVLGIGALFFTQSTRAAAIADSLEKAEADSTRYSSVLRERLKAESTRDTILRQLNIVRAVDGERYVWPHVLDEVSRALPQYTWLTGVAYFGTEQGAAAKQIVQAAAPDTTTPKTAADSAKKFAPKVLDTTVPLDTIRVRIAGQTVDIQALTRFMRDLEQSPFLERVQLEKSELVLVEGKEATQFSLLANFERPDSTAVRRVPLAAVAP